MVRDALQGICLLRWITGRRATLTGKLPFFQEAVSLQPSSDIKTLGRQLLADRQNARAR